MRKFGEGRKNFLCCRPGPGPGPGHGDAKTFCVSGSGTRTPFSHNLVKNNPILEIQKAKPIRISLVIQSLLV